uniref:Nematode cuticle collagen N-terminal domain-containing protein n=1 Tax=Loa loa TaxID=7209 RepID=A0A1I7VZ47_LOALO
MSGIRMPYARQFNGDGPEASTTLKLVAMLMASLYTSGLLAIVYMLIMISKFDKELEHCTTTKIAITDAKVTIVDIKSQK